METKEARHWLHQFAVGLVSDEVIGSRFGMELLEVFQMWLAITDDMDIQVRNCGDAVCHAADTVREDEGEESDASTVAVGSRETGENAGVDKPGYIAPEEESTRPAGVDREEEKPGG